MLFVFFGDAPELQLACFFRFSGADLKLSAFSNLGGRACLEAMSSAPYEKELFPHLSPHPGTVFVNDRVCFQTEEDQRVISVHGVVFSHYSIKDRAAEAYAMVLLFESGYADQNDIARCFGYSARSLRRYQERLKTGGLSALARPRGRPAVSSPVHKKTHARDQTVLRLKAKGMSNRWIAGRLGRNEKVVRKDLRRLGWKPSPEPDLPFFPEADSPAEQATVSASMLSKTPPSAAEQPTDKMPQPQSDSPARSLDANPLDRSIASSPPWDFSTMPFPYLLPHGACQERELC